MPINHGVAVYELLPNGCLNGVFAETDRDLHNDIFNEILRKKPNGNNFDLNGDYTAVVIDIDHKILTYDVEIRDKNGKIQMQWLINSILQYEGTGWKTRENQLTVSYRKIPNVA